MLGNKHSTDAKPDKSDADLASISRGNNGPRYGFALQAKMDSSLDPFKISN